MQSLDLGDRLLLSYIHTLKFQADSFLSGSISFGRYETESLSWERWSSFSHNRYLEEVEKYSKPGSVTEKKAYFEAHFRKKALLKQQSSSECQSGTESQISENGDQQNMAYFGNKNEDIHFSNSDESPSAWEYDRECEPTKCDRESTGVLYCESQITTDMDSIDAFDDVKEHVKPKESRQSESDIIPEFDDEPQIEEDKRDENVSAHVTSCATDSSSSSHTADRDDCISSRPHVPSSMVCHLTSALHFSIINIFLIFSHIFYQLDVVSTNNAKDDN